MTTGKLGYVDLQSAIGQYGEHHSLTVKTTAGSAESCLRGSASCRACLIPSLSLKIFTETCLNPNTLWDASTVTYGTRRQYSPKPGQLATIFTCIFGDFAIWETLSPIEGMDADDSPVRGQQTDRIMKYDKRCQQGA